MISDQLSHSGPASQTVATLSVDGVAYEVAIRSAFDGVEHVGRVGFAVAGSGDAPLYDYGLVPGSTPDEVAAAVLRFTDEDLLKRFRRAHAEKRKFIPLRRSVDEILAKVKYMNRIAISMRSGTLEVAAAGQELELVTEQIQGIVSHLKDVAS